MASVTFSTLVGGDGSTVSDGIDPTTGLANGGHRTRFVPALAQIVAIAQVVLQNVAIAVDAAASALGGASTSATSPTTAAIPSIGATLSITTQTGKGFIGGMRLVAADHAGPTTKAVYGRVQSYNTGTGALVILADDVIGSGSVANWDISVSAFGVPASRSIVGAGLATGGGDFTANRVITVTAASDADITALTATDKVVVPAHLKAIVRKARALAVAL